MKKTILLLSLLWGLSCGEIKPVIVLDAGICPVCITGRKCPTVPVQCTTQNIESCVEKCWSENSCFFSFGPKSCLKKCSKICLNKFGCKWATQ